MLYVHERNILNKIANNYMGRGHVEIRHELNEFYNEVYMPMRTHVLSLQFDNRDSHDFDIAADEFNTYYMRIEDFSARYNISSQSKFVSTFLEEISCYLFKDLPSIRDNTFGVYNKGIYAGLKIDNNGSIAVIKKDVDFCIGKKVSISIDAQPYADLILPVVAVEVKTYLDATMFGEIKSSSKSIRSASPNSKAYVLMGYKDLADSHIIAARQDSTLTEMFALKEEEHSPILASVLRDYWFEIKNAVDCVTTDDVVPNFGRILYP